MAGEKPIPVKVSIDPFQEFDKKKWKKIEADVKEFKKPGRVDISGKFEPTTAKWDKRKLEAQARAIFRYDLSLYASQIWQAFVPIGKAKNGQDKKKASSEFIKDMPKLQKAMVRNLNEKFVEFQEDIASGAGDDLGQLKSTRKSLTAGHPEAMINVVSDFAQAFDDVYEPLVKLKKKEQKSSGPAKEEASKEFDDLLKAELPKLQKVLSAQSSVLKKRLGVLSGIPAAIKKGLSKDLSDGAKAEFKKSMDALSKATGPVEASVGKFEKGMLDVIKRLARKDVGSSVWQELDSVASKVLNSLDKLDELMKKIDAKLKKLEQTAKSRK
ncbi:MAG: hypothetical protein GQ535_12610 [Rhodobacteraceae bacterium]|nr:hypothetical protein [Paracoccaceae bacterium]